MDLINLLSIKKFTPVSEIFKQFNSPLFKLGERPAYYMGNGFLLSYSSNMFKIVNNNRVQFGDEGEYALSVYYFIERKYLEAYFKIGGEKFDFKNDILGELNVIFEPVKMEWTFEQVSMYLRTKANEVYYHEGETRTLNGDVFGFQNHFINYDNYTFFFFEKSKKTKISGFEFVLVE